MANVLHSGAQPSPSPNPNLGPTCCNSGAAQVISKGQWVHVPPATKARCLWRSTLVRGVGAGLGLGFGVGLGLGHGAGAGVGVKVGVAVGVRVRLPLVRLPLAQHLCTRATYHLLLTY